MNWRAIPLWCSVPHATTHRGKTHSRQSSQTEISGSVHVLHIIVLLKLVSLSKVWLGYICSSHRALIINSPSSSGLHCC